MANSKFWLGNSVFTHFLLEQAYRLRIRLGLLTPREMDSAKRHADNMAAGIEEEQARILGF